MLYPTPNPHPFHVFTVATFLILVSIAATV